jgi:hypothetical protein
MEKKNYFELSDDALLMEKKKLKKNKIFHAILIGFLAGILIFGFVTWILSAERRAGFLIPMLFPVFFIYKLIKSPNHHKELEEVLRKRNL